MLSASVTVTNQLGLHARAAAKLVRLASSFNCRITLFRRDTSVYADAKSILSLLTLAASRGTVLELEVNGEDEKEAFAAIEALFISGFADDDT